MNSLFTKIKTAFIWSTFITFSLCFPFLNALELILYSTQKTFFIFCLILNCLLFLTFIPFPFVFKLSIEYIFSKFSLLFLQIFETGSQLLNKYPRIVGFFYGICFLSFLFRSEWQNSTSLSILSSVLLAIRNLTVIPSLGFYSLAKWTSLTLDRLVKEKKLTESSIKDSLNNFELFNSTLFQHLPLVNQNPSLYNVETRRYMFRWTRTTINNLPEGEALSRTVRTTIGTTLSGSFGLTMYSTGSKAESSVKANLAEAKTTLEKIANSRTANPALRETAREMCVVVDATKLDWDTHKKHSAPITGIQVLLNEEQTRVTMSQAQNLLLESSKLKALAGSELKSPSQKMEVLNGIRKQSGLSESIINSPRESIIFVFKKLVNFF